MIILTLTVDDIDTVLQVYNRIQLQRSDSESGEYTTVSGLGPTTLVGGISTYEVIDSTGEDTNWYISRYYSTNTGNSSSWSDPVLGSVGCLFNDPLYPPEISYGTSDRAIIDRIRVLIGDPKRLSREYGEEAMSSIHPDGKTYEMAEKGYPVSINMAGRSFTSTSNPTIDGYRYLRFQEYIDVICTTCSGITDLCGDEVTREIANSIDLWCYTFRQSDRQIMNVYDSCPPPIGLTSTIVTSQAYMLQTAIDIIRKELWEDSVEDGAEVTDERSKYNPEPGQKVRKALLDDLQRQLEKLVNSLKMYNVSGVLID